MLCSVGQRIVIVEEYIRTASISSVREKFHGKYSRGYLSAKSTFQEFVKIWRTTGSVSNKKKNKQPTVKTPEVMPNVANVTG